MFKDIDIVKSARSFIGVPWVHQGRNRYGLDCAGLIVAVGQNLGISGWDVNFNYSRDPDGRMQPHIEERAQLLSELKIGALIMIKIRYAPQHLAIVSDYGDNFGMIHAYQSIGKVVEHELIDWWRDRIVGIYALPEVEYESIS